MSFVQSTALLVSIRSSSLNCALHVFVGIFPTLILGCSLFKWHVFYITVLKIIYITYNDIHGIHEIYA